MNGSTRPATGPPCSYSGIPPGLALIGIDPAEPDSLEPLSYLRRQHPSTPVILLFAAPHPDRYRQALRMGASAVLKFPPPTNQLRAAVTQALETAGTPRPGGIAPEQAGGLSSIVPVGSPLGGPMRSAEGRQPEELTSSGPCTCTCHARRGAAPVGEAASTPVIVQAGAPLRPLKEALEGPEREIIARTLEAFGGSRQETAKALDINRTTLYKRMKKYGLLDEEGE